MNVTLTSESQQFIQQKIDAGEYRSVDEAVNQLLSFVHQREQITADDQDLLADIDIGIRDADAGRFIDFSAEQVMAEGRARLANRRNV